MNRKKWVLSSKNRPQFAGAFDVATQLHSLQWSQAAGPDKTHGLMWPYVSNPGQLHGK